MLTPKTYLLVTPENDVSKEKLCNQLSHISGILETYTSQKELGIFLRVSKNWSADNLSNKIAKLIPKVRFLITRLTKDYEGINTPETWAFVKNFDIEITIDD